MKLTLVLIISLLSVLLARPSEGDVIDKIKARLQKFKDWASRTWSSAGDWFKDKKEKAKAWISGALANTNDWFKSVTKGIADFYHDHIEPFYKDIVDTSNKIKEAYSFIKERVQNGFNDQHRAEVAQKLQEVFNYIADKADKYFYDALNHIERFIIEYTSRLGKKIIGHLKKNKISEKCRLGVATAYDLYYTSLTPKLQDCVTEVKNEVEAAYNSTKDLFLGIPTTVTDIVEDIASCFKPSSNITSCVKQAGVSIMNAAVGFVSDFISVKIIIASAADKVAGARACITGAAKDAAIDIEILKNRKQLQNDLIGCGLKAANDILEYMSS